LMLPFITSIASHSPAVIVVVAAHTAYLTIVVLDIFGGGDGVVGVEIDRALVQQVGVGVVVTIDRLDRKGGLCHAISSHSGRVGGGRFR
jgi:hypothetical protein